MLRELPHMLLQFIIGAFGFGGRPYVVQDCTSVRCLRRWRSAVRDAARKDHHRPAYEASRAALERASALRVSLCDKRTARRDRNCDAGLRCAWKAERSAGVKESGAMLGVLQLILGGLWFVGASVLFWRIDPKRGVRPRWVTMPGMQSVVVFVVLGGWALGGAMLIMAAIGLFSG